MTSKKTPVAASGTFSLGGVRTVHRLGFGAMRITGPGVWGPPRNHDEAIRVLRRAVELGVDFIDTADSYGPEVSENLIREALHPYEGITIATKAGFIRTGPGRWTVDCNPGRLRRAADDSLRRLGVETIDLYQLHRIDPRYPLEDQVGVFKELQDAGKVRLVGLSETTVEQTAAARRIVDVVSVQNEYNVVNRKWESVLEYCDQEGIAFLPWYPIAVGKLADPGGPVGRVAEELGATPVQVALAWLLKRSPVLLPIPGTGSVEHLEEDLAAAELELDEGQFRRIEEAARQAG